MNLRFDVLLVFDYQNFRISNLDLGFRILKKDVLIFCLLIQKVIF